MAGSSCSSTTRRVIAQADWRTSSPLRRASSPTLVGIAIERKLIAGVEEPIVRWFPELRKDADTRKQAITIEDC